MTPDNPAAEVTPEMRAEWAYRIEADCRKSLPTKGAMQEALRDAVTALDAAEQRLAAVRALADEWEADLGERVPLDREGTCDGCAETKRLVASYPTPDNEPWVCAECDAEARRCFTDLRAALGDADGGGGR